MVCRSTGDRKPSRRKLRQAPRHNPAAPSILRAPKEVSGALLGTDSEFRSAEITDHQRVAGQDEPRFFGPCAVRYQGADMLGRWARRIQPGPRAVADRTH